MAGRVYAYPDLGRAGLGNMLFPWARAEVFAARHNVRILSPRWVQPKVGPLLRGERDLRYYTGLFDNARGGYVLGLRRASILLRSHRIAEAEAESAFQGGGVRIVVFKGWHGWFEGLLPHRDFIAGRLNAILSASTRARLAAAGGPTEIGVHVRRGDKVPIRFGAALTGDAAETLPDQWYLNAIRSVRIALGREAPVRVFTDANPEQVDLLLKEPGVTLSPDNTSIVDILMLSRARVLIATGGSSFSGWASYLGGMPTVWYPGSGMTLIEGRAKLSIETDLEGRIGERCASVIAGARG